ncbi:MAG: CHAT domain-containing tetratricopeptide repeat protein [Pyrinomonadaceae bacterium]
MRGIYRSLAFGLFSVLFFLSAVGAQHDASAPAPAGEYPQIDFGQTVEREISGGQKHVFRLDLNAGEFVRIEVEQTDCDVILSFQSPEENVNLFEYKDDNFRNGPESQTVAIEKGGQYLLKLISFEKPDQKGSYTLKVAERRPATEKETNQSEGLRIVNGLAKNVKTGTATTAEIEKVIEDFNVALKKFQLAENRTYEAVTLSAIGSFYSRLGKWKKAVELQKESLNISRRIGDTESISLMLSNLGTTYLRTNEPQKALEVLQQSVKISVEREDTYNEARALSLIGNVYERFGDADRALIYYEQALKKAESIGQDRFIAVSLNDLGKANFIAGNYESALKFFRRAIETARKNGNKRQEASYAGNLGQAFFASGDAEKALQTLTEALEINLALTDRIGEAVIRKKIGQIYLRMGQTDRAFEYLNRALEIFNSVEDQQNRAETLLSLAKAESKKGNLATAQTRIEEAIGLIETIRARVETAELRDLFSANLQDFYGFYVRLLMQRDDREPGRGFAARALQVNERARARGLLNLLNESGAGIGQGVDPKLLAREIETKDLLSARLENLTKILGGKSKAEETEKLKIEIENIRAELERVQTLIRISSPRYAALTQPKTLDLKEIQTEILDPGSVMLEYALGAEKSYLWIVSKDDFRAVELAPGAEIENLARGFYAALTERNREIKFETAAERKDRILRSDADLERLSGELSRRILAPAAPFLADKRLLIVADGALQYVPFAGLVNPKRLSGVPGNDQPQAGEEKKFLIETNEIVNLPSASVLAVLRRESDGRRAAPKTLAVLADPIFDRQDERFQAMAAGRNGAKTEFMAVSKKGTRAAELSATRDGLELPRLPFTRREAELISASVPESQREKLLDFAASRASAMSPELASYRYVHFATHGFINNENPELSGIVFSMIDEEGRERDGFLRVGDIYNLRLPVEMVVLSGCRTGLGKEIKGEGLVGLTRGFMYAGARRVAVSLWDVSDEATSELMARFYRAMLGDKKLAPASALRRAQIDLIREKRWKNPYYWAAFTLQGEPL